VLLLFNVHNPSLHPPLSPSSSLLLPPLLSLPPSLPSPPLVSLKKTQNASLTRWRSNLAHRASPREAEENPRRMTLNLSSWTDSLSSRLVAARIPTKWHIPPLSLTPWHRNLLPSRLSKLWRCRLHQGSHCNTHCTRWVGLEFSAYNWLFSDLLWHCLMLC